MFFIIDRDYFPACDFYSLTALSVINQYIRNVVDEIYLHVTDSRDKKSCDQIITYRLLNPNSLRGLSGEYPHLLWHSLQTGVTIEFSLK